MSSAPLLLLLCFAPLAFGTTETWSVAAAETLAAVAVLLHFRPCAARRTAFQSVPGLLPLLLLLLWLLAQCLPLPPALMQALSPQTAAVWQPVLDLLPPDTWIPLSLNPQAALREGLRLGSYVLVYILAAQLLCSGRRLSLFLSSIAGLTLCIAIVTMLQRAAAPESLFWLRPVRSGFGSFGPWVYRNHYAGFMVMTCPLLLAACLLNLPERDGEEETLRQRLLRLCSGSGLHLLFGFGAMAAVASVFLSQSRGGILSLTVALLVFVLLLAWRMRERWLILPLLAVLLAGAWFNWDSLLLRFQYAVDPNGGLRDDRLLIWRDTFRIIADFPLTGAGVGSFADVFPSYKTLADDLFYDHAHNDFLELLAEGGAIGFLLAAWFAWTVLRSGWRQIFSRHDRLAVLTAISAFSGLAGLLFFSLTDFNLHNWANGLHCFFLCALLAAAGRARQHHRRPAETAAQSPAAGGLVFLGAAVLLLAVLRLHGGALTAAAAYSWAKSAAEEPGRSAEEKSRRIEELLEEARRGDPWNGLYPYLLGRIRMRQRRPELALPLHVEAARRQPLEEKYLRAAARARQARQ
ncbi:O-antigen ligase family protein [Candidatus Electronema sp. TJ]|uniref:O-antigen ligase family protein n=1 Tax=Candidatus Electronema sp. TJ TaxID=3401573 RepID=UPI003AA9C226